jgi:transposase
MPKSLSGDLRERVIEAVEAGASRREAAERFEISPSSEVRWLQRWRAQRILSLLTSYMTGIFTDQSAV